MRKIVRRPRAVESSDAPSKALAYNIVPEWGGGADLRAIETDVSNAVTVTDHAKKTDRGIRVVVPISEPNSKYSPSSGGAKGSNACGAGIGDPGDPMYSLMASRPHAVAYEVDKERGLPNSQSVKVREIKVAGTITADGDPAEKNDRGTRILAPTLTASNDPSRSPQSSEVTAMVEAVQREVGLVRRLTPTECERLQGFPDGWTIL